LRCTQPRESWSSDPLPQDVETLHSLLRDVLAERDAALVERDLLAGQNDRLRHPLRQLQRMQFGRRSEKLPRPLRSALRAQKGRISGARIDGAATRQHTSNIALGKNPISAPESSYAFSQTLL
jgi:hypothetical protein